MIIKHTINERSIITKDTIEYEHEGELLNQQEKIAQEEAGPDWNIVHGMILCGEFANTYHVVVIFSSKYSAEIRTYVYEVS